jgi:ABC-2 type transport system ATP-binding protein
VNGVELSSPHDVSSAPSAVVATQSLSKHYGTFAALEDCTLDVHRGEVFGLLGPNGAGKTTLLRLLLGYLNPTRGTARVDGWDCFRQSVHVRRSVSYLPGEAKLHRRMRAREVLEFFVHLRGAKASMPRSLELAERLELDTSRRVALMSTGMRQKLALIVTLSVDAPLMILDEPTANLDPNIRREVMRIVAQLHSEGRTIMLSSHVLPEIEETCDRVMILRAGSIVHLQEMAPLRRRHRITARAPDALPVVPESLASRVHLWRAHDRLHMDSTGDLADLLGWLSSLSLIDVTIEPYGLRAVYDRFHQRNGEDEA